MVYKILMFIFFLYSAVYTVSYASYELKQRKILSFFGVISLVICSAALAVCMLIRMR